MVKRGACVAWACVCAVAAACGGAVDNRYNGAQIGQPCTPAVEDDTTFNGFQAQMVSVELPSPDADPGVLVCLANHFRGRVTCPYGQNADGTGLPAVDGASGGPFPSGVGPCVTPSGAPVTGTASDPKTGAQVEPQCADREAARTVTWSCRCAAADGTTNGAGTYCACPGGTECVQLVPPIGTLNDDVSGAYCIPTGSDYVSYGACALACDPSVTTCP